MSTSGFSLDFTTEQFVEVDPQQEEWNEQAMACLNNEGVWSDNHTCLSPNMTYYQKTGLNPPNNTMNPMTADLGMYVGGDLLLAGLVPLAIIVALIVFRPKGVERIAKVALGRDVQRQLKLDKKIRGDGFGRTNRQIIGQDGRIGVADKNGGGRASGKATVEDLLKSNAIKRGLEDA